MRAGSSIAVLLVSLLAGCTSPVTVPAEVDRSRDAIAFGAQEPGTAGRRVLMKLRLRDVDMIVASSGEGGPRFALARRDGVELARDLDVAALEARHPEIYRLYRSAVASRVGASYLDARLDRAAEGRTDDARGSAVLPGAPSR